MRRLGFLILLITQAVAAAMAYQYPVKDVKGLHSASFAEMRPDHFHSGVDIKTDGRIGKPVVAAEDGYISRVSHSCYGYGLAVYVAHPSRGTMTVYGHLSRFTEQMIANPLDLDIAVTIFPKSRVPAGGNMAFRREVFDRVGLFNPQLGRNGQSLVGGEENDLFARLRRAGELLYFVPNAAIYHHIPDSKLTDDYFDRLSYNVGVSKRMRAEADGEAETLLKKERTKQLATYLLYLLYMLMLQPLKAKYLLRMRNGIYKGVKQL